jgi:curved DNA-binding protein CbpA
VNFEKMFEQEAGEEERHFESDHELRDPYDVLGLDRTATLEEIRRAYFTNVREHPPEREPEVFKRIRAAYDALRTPEAKAATDLFLIHPPREYEPYKRPPSFDLAFYPEDWLLMARAYSDLGRVDFRDDYRDNE